METTAEQIKRLEQELAALRDKERTEREEARKKKREEKAALTDDTKLPAESGEHVDGHAVEVE